MALMKLINDFLSVIFNDKNDVATWYHLTG